MSYSQRQQHCLEAMGIVPWISRLSKTTAVSEQSPVSSELSIGIPSDLRKLAAWLGDQTLLTFAYKGSDHTALGHPEAPLLVVVQHDEQREDDLPLSGDAAQLFELMMRSINLGRSDIRQCSLAGNLKSPNSSSNEIQTVSSVCTAHTRAILILQAMDESSDVKADAHHCRLAESQLPVWRIAHPDLLLRENQRKRQAWQAMKALQQFLEQFMAPGKS